MKKLRPAQMYSALYYVSAFTYTLALATLCTHASFIPTAAFPQVRSIDQQMIQPVTPAIAQFIADPFKAEIVHQLIEETRNYRAATIIVGDIAGNPHHVKDQGQFKKDIIQWKSKIDSDLQLIEIALSSNIQPSYPKLITLGSALAAYAEALNEAVIHQFKAEYRYIPTHQHTTDLTTRCKTLVETEQGPEIRTNPDAEFIIQQQMLVKLTENISKKQMVLATNLREYGLTIINKAAISGHDAYRRFTNIPLVRDGWPFFIAGGVTAALLKITGLAAEQPGGLAALFATGLSTTASQLIIEGAKYAVGKSPAMGRILARKIEALKGGDNKDNRSYEDPLIPVTVEECEAKKEPVIGAEHEFEEIVAEIEAGVAGFKQGKKEFLRDKRRCFKLVAAAGQGKTYLMQQIKIAIAEKNRDLGLEIAFVALTPEWLGKGGTIRYFIEKAQKENKGIVLWLDEIHLAKASKDGDRSALLELLAETEWINKSNHPIWLFVATNEGGHGDKALTRDGRFVVIELYKYLLPNRVEFLKKQLEKRGVKIFDTKEAYQKALAQGDIVPGAVALFAEDIQLLAQQAHGCTPATLNQVLSLASGDAHGGAPTLAHLQKRIFEKVFRFTRGFKDMQHPEQQEVAVYQAGRILIYILNCMQRNFPIPLFVMATSSALSIPFSELAAYNFTQPIVVNPNMENRRTFGDLFYYDPRELLPYTGTNLGKEDDVRVRLAGICAQQLLLDRKNDEYSMSDRERAFESCKKLALLAQGFVKIDSLSKVTREKTLQVAEELFMKYRAEDEALLLQHKAVLEKIALHLSNPDTPYIMGQEVVALLSEHAKTV